MSSDLLSLLALLNIPQLDGKIRTCRSQYVVCSRMEENVANLSASCQTKIYIYKLAVLTRTWFSACVPAVARELEHRSDLLLLFLILFWDVPDHDLAVFSTRRNHIIVERMKVGVQNRSGVSTIKRVVIGKFS